MIFIMYLSGFSISIANSSVDGACFLNGKGSSSEDIVASISEFEEW